MARTMRAAEPYPVTAAAPSRIRWGAVFGGAVVGLSLLILLTTLWLAIGFGNDVPTVADNIAWFVTGSAIASMFVGGLTAGWLSGVPGTGAGFFNGLTVWAIALLVALFVGVPGIIGVTGLGFDLTDPPTTADLAARGDGLWAGFASLLVGAVTAALGGMLGGGLTRPRFAPPADTEEPTRMPVGASDRGYDLGDERAYDRETLNPEEQRIRRREAEQRARAGSVPPPPPREGDDWSSST